jgi:hypothetical protein
MGIGLRAARRLHMVESLEPRTMLTVYYVSTSGSDSNAGTSTSAPWATVTKVDATPFQPGDQILFQRGDEWHGQLTADASGTAANPIVYGAYGNSSLPTPIFDGSDVIPNSAFSLVSGSTYSFSVSNVPGADGNAYWVYANHIGLDAAAADDSSSGGVLANADSFYINGTTVYVNTGGVNVSSGTVVYTLGDRGAGTNANSSLINSNGFSYVTFEDIEGRETAEVGGGNSLTGGIADGYVFRIQGGSNITLLDDDGEYGSKHIYGAIDTTGFVANGITAEGAPEGVPGNGLPYGNATATVAYSDQNQTGDTYQWINTTVSNYDSGQPAFLTHGNDNAIASILLQNFVSLGSPIALEPAAGVAITITGGEITNNTLTAYSDTNVTEIINGLTLTGSGSAIEVYGNSTVENCLLEGSSQSNQAIQVSGANNLIRFNTIDPPSYSTAIALENNSTNTTIYGNLVTGTANAISIGSSTTYTADYDFFDNTNGSPTFGGQSLAQFKTAGYETHSVTGNPLFTNAAEGNFSLQSTSPAINTIPINGITGITTDIRGYTRPSGNAFDMGAYEYQSVLHQPTIATAASATPNPVTGTTASLSVLGASPDGEPTLNYTWNASGPAIVNYSSNGTNASKNSTATFIAAGTYYFTVTVSNGTYSTTSSVTVTVDQVPQGVTISPATMFVAINTTQQYTAIVADQFGNPVVGSTVTYSIQSGGGVINSSTGVFTAPGTTGTTTIRATSGSSSVTATANITPPNQAPTVVTSASASPNPVTSTITTLSVLGGDQDGEASLTYTWTTIGSPPAAVGFSINGTNAAKSTVATFTANGTYNFLVTIAGPGGLTTTSSTTATVSIFVPIVVDGTLDGRYGTPIVVQTQATNYGNGNDGNPIAPYSQLSAAYGVIDQTDGQFDLFLAGSLDLVNAHLDLFIDSIPGEGAANTSALASVGPWGGTGFSDITFDTTFRPDHLFTFAYGGGYSLSYFNFDTDTDANDNMTDPATGLATSSGNIPYFSERVNNAAENSIVAANTGAGVTTGAEFAFNLSGLGYTTADYNASDPIGVMAIISYGSHTQPTNQVLPPSSIIGNGSYSYYGSNFDFSSASFPGNQYFQVTPPASYSGPTIATAASVTPNPVTSNSAALAVLGADPNGESTLTYTWSTTGTPPASVAFGANGTNAAKNTTATFTANGTYNFLVTVTDGNGLTTTSTVTATVTGVTVTNQPPTVVTPASATPSPVAGKTTALSVLGSDDSGESNLTYTWVTTGSPPAAVSFSANGTNAAKNITATFTKAGSYSFIVTIEDSGGLTTTSSVTVTVNQTPATISVSPPTPSVTAGTTQQFSAAVYDQFGALIASPSLTWSVASGIGSISTSGLYTAPGSTGSATIKAVAGSVDSTAAVTITAANLNPTVVTPATAGTSPVTGNTTVLSVLGNDPAGAAGLTYIWTSTSTPANAPAPTFTLNGSNAAKTTTAQFFQAGTYILTATIYDPSGYSVVSSVTVVVNQTVSSLYVLPPKANVTPGATQQYSVKAIDQFSDLISSVPVTWSVTGGGAINSAGLFTANQSSGTYTVQAISGLTATTTLTVQQSGPLIVTLSALAASNHVIDIGSSGLIVPNAGAAGLAQVEAELKAGANFTGGYWNGTSGITSTSAAGDTTRLTAVGFILNNNDSLTNPAPIYTTFKGASTGLNDILVMYTYYGDANLDGKVDGSDYSRIDNGYLNHLSGWANGDFNYDGVVDGSDYTLIDNAFNRQRGVIQSLIATQSAQPTKTRTIVASLMPTAYIPQAASLFSQAPITSIAGEIFDSASGRSIFS